MDNLGNTLAGTCSLLNLQFATQTGRAAVVGLRCSYVSGQQGCQVFALYILLYTANLSLQQEPCHAL